MRKKKNGTHNSGLHECQYKTSVVGSCLVCIVNECQICLLLLYMYTVLVQTVLLNKSMYPLCMYTKVHLYCHRNTITDWLWVINHEYYYSMYGDKVGNWIWGRTSMEDMKCVCGGWSHDLYTWADHTAVLVYTVYNKLHVYVYKATVQHRVDSWYSIIITLSTSSNTASTLHKQHTQTHLLFSVHKIATIQNFFTTGTVLD